MYKNKGRPVMSGRRNSILTGSILSSNENLPPKIRKFSVQSNVHFEENYCLSSQGSVPLSQSLTQRRYFSQRNTLSRTQSKTFSRTPNSYFEMVLMKSGADIDQPEAVILSCDHVIFVTQLRNILSQHQDYPSNVKSFMDGFRGVFNNDSMALKLLNGCNVKISASDTFIQSQDSVVIDLLMITFLQKYILKSLMNKVESFAKSSSCTIENISLIPMILAQMKYVATLHKEFLYNKLISIFQNATNKSKKEIISSSEYILDPTQHEDFVNYLIEISTSNEELLNYNNIQAFTNLQLGSVTLKNLRKKIVCYIKTGCNFSLLPIFIIFLLKTANNEDDSIAELILDLRDCLNSFTRPEVTEQNDSIQAEVFSAVHQTLSRSKDIFDCWQQIIQNAAINDFGPIDFVILIMMMSVREEKCTYLKNIIHRRIKLGQFTIPLFKKTATIFGDFLFLYINILLSMFSGFLRRKEILISNFAKSGYKIIFEIDNSYKKKVINHLVEVTCDKSESYLTTLSLEVLEYLNMNHQLKSYGFLLLPILDRLSELNTNQFRMVMELLCEIAYAPSSLSQVLQDRIDMIVKKQIISRTALTKKHGITGIVLVISHLIRTEETTESMCDLDVTYDSVDDLPEGKAKLAANLTGRILSATTCPESLALFYDELAMACFSKYTQNNNLAFLNKCFLIWICDLVTNFFQNYFVIEAIPTGLEITLSYQNGINASEGNSCSESKLYPIAINISGSVLNSSNDSNSSITILSPLFKLMAVLHFIRHNGSLESINAVLGCAIILPSFMEFDHDFDIFSEYDEQMAKKILDIHFHLANWYREILSVFSTQEDEGIRKKVLLRLSKLIKLEELIQNLLWKATFNYTPPICQFMTHQGIFSKRPRKVTKSKLCSQNKYGHYGTESTTTNKQKGEKAKINQNRSNNYSHGIHFEDLYGYIANYRQMNSRIMLILREKLILQHLMPRQVLGIYMGILEYRFILYDLVNKLESVTSPNKILIKQPYQFVIRPADFVNDLIRFVPRIMTFFKQFLDTLNIKLNDVNGVLDNISLFTDEFNYLKICFDLSLRLFNGLLSWNGFDEDCNQNLLKELLTSLILSNRETSNCDIKELASINFNFYLKLEKKVITIKSAVNLYHVLISFQRISNKDSLVIPLRNLCHTFLLCKWYGFDRAVEKGSACNILLNSLTKGFLKDIGFKTLKEQLALVFQEIEYIKKKHYFLSFPNFHKANFPILFRGFCEALIDIINSHLNSDMSMMSGLEMWEQSCEILNTLLNYVKSLDIPQNFFLFLKYANIVLKIFLEHGLSILEKLLRESPERVNDLLKSLQITTRFLHNLCCHSKANKNSSVVSQIPYLRETIENLVFHVKAALAANDCSAVFWMGNLKNKDICGDEIFSQSPSLISTENDNSREISNDNKFLDEQKLDSNNLNDSLDNHSSKSF